MLKKFSGELFFQGSAFDHIYVVFSLNEALCRKITINSDLIAISYLGSPDRYIVHFFPKRFKPFWEKVPKWGIKKVPKWGIIFIVLIILIKSELFWRTFLISFYQIHFFSDLHFFNFLLIKWFLTFHFILFLYKFCHISNLPWFYHFISLSLAKSNYSWLYYIKIIF